MTPARIAALRKATEAAAKKKRSAENCRNGHSRSEYSYRYSNGRIRCTVCASLSDIRKNSYNRMRKILELV